MLVALKPKPMLAGVADAGAASRSTAAASTAGTSAMTFIFIIQVLPCCHRESVAHTAGDTAPAALTKSAAEQQARASVQTDRRTPTQAEAVNLYEAPASGNYWAASSVSGLLIHAVVGSLGGWGSLRTNRSGWAA